MENLSSSRIQQVSPGQEKNRDLAKPKKHTKSEAAADSVSIPPLSDGENEEKHQLDEQA